MAGGALAIRPSGSVMASNITGRKQSSAKTGGVSGGPKIVRPEFSGSNELTKKDPNADALVGSSLRIKTSVIQIDSFLKRDLKEQKKQVTLKRKAAERARRGEEEQELEAKDKGQDKKVGLPIPKQVKSWWQGVVDFFFGILWGWLALKLIDWLPDLQGILPTLGSIFDWIIKIGGWIFNALVTFVDWAYSLVEAFSGFIGNIFGEDGKNAFDNLLKNVGLLINAAIIAALAVMKFTGIGGIIATAGQVGGAMMGAIQGVIGFVAAGGLATVGIIAGAGLLASALGEGAYQLLKIGEDLEKGARERYEEKWWTDPRKYLDWMLLQGARFVNFQLRTIGTLLDVVGYPFRMIIELLRYPFLDEKGKKKQAENIKKYNERIRKNFSSILNTVTFGLFGKQDDDFDPDKKELHPKPDESLRETNPKKYKREMEKYTEEQIKKDRGMIGKDAPAGGGGRTMTGLADFLTFGVWDFDQRGNLFGGKHSKSGFGGELSEQDKERVKRSGSSPGTTSSTKSSREVTGRFDTETGTPYINGKKVSMEEYTTFVNMSDKEKLKVYGTIAIPEGGSVTLGGEADSNVGGSNIVDIGKSLVSEGFSVSEHPDFTKDTSGGRYTPGAGIVHNVHKGKGHYQGRALDVTYWRGGDPGYKAAYHPVLDRLYADRKKNNLKMLIHDTWGDWYYPNASKSGPGSYGHPTHMHIETKFHEGGVVPGKKGKELAAKLLPGETVVDVDSSQDPEVQDLLLAINQASTTPEVMEAIEQFTPYEARPEPEIIFMDSPDSLMGSGKSRMIPVPLPVVIGGGDGSDNSFDFLDKGA